MDLTNTEFIREEEVATEVPQRRLTELSELQLVLIGGGIADPIAF